MQVYALSREDNSYLRCELERVTKERDNLVAQIKQDSLTWDTRVTAVRAEGMCIVKSYPRLSKWWCQWSHGLSSEYYLSAYNNLCNFSTVATKAFFFEHWQVKWYVVTRSDRWVFQSTLVSPHSEITDMPPPVYTKCANKMSEIGVLFSFLCLFLTLSMYVRSPMCVLSNNLWMVQILVMNTAKMTVKENVQIICKSFNSIVNIQVKCDKTCKSCQKL